MQRDAHLNNAALMARRRAALPSGLGQTYDIVCERALNAEVWDVEGKRYIDFAGGIAVLNTGHRHPKVVAAVQAQLDKVHHTCFQVLAYEPYIELAERLIALAPGDFAKKAFFLTTGAEAVENAVKIARSATKRSAVIAFGGGFHGRTLLGMALTGKVAPYKAGFGPFPAEIYHAKYPNPLHGVTEADALASIESIFKYDVEPARVAAIVVEPVQGEGGFYAISPAFAQALRALCDRHGIVLIADEVQTGAGRTGTWLASEQWGAAPDIITMAKSMAGGFPISAVIGRAELMDAPGPGGLGGPSPAPPGETGPGADDGNASRGNGHDGPGCRACATARGRFLLSPDVRGGIPERSNRYRKDHNGHRFVLTDAAFVRFALRPVSPRR